MKHQSQSKFQLFAAAVQWILLVIFIVNFILFLSEDKSFEKFEKVKSQYLSSEAQLLDRQGRALQDLRIKVDVRKFEWVRLQEVSQPLKDFILLTEDKRFFEHHGVDYLALANSLLSTFNTRHVRGASTLTMQVVSFLDTSLKRGGSRRSLFKKWEQMRAAEKLEREWTKAQIFEAYLNFVSFKGELVGTSAASQVLFAKSPSALNKIEAAILASLIRSPNANQKMLERRTCALLAKIQYFSLNEGADCIAAVFPALKQAFSSAGDLRFKALRAQYAPELARLLFKRDPNLKKIHSTIDLRLQKELRVALNATLAQLKTQNVREGAVLVVDHQSNEVLAYIANPGKSFVDGILAKRQAGSTLKPLLYAAAIDAKYLTQASLLDDSPVDIPVAGGVYRPANYDKTFHGQVPLNQALASSLNVPAVKTLMLVGVEKFHAVLENFGFKNLREPNFYGPSLALGSVDVSLFELVQAYSALARGGEFRKLKLTMQQKDEIEPTHLLSPQAAYIVNEILSSNQNREMGFGLHSSLDFKYWVAAKTGTSKDMRDNWCVGFSDRFTVGVWIGNFNGEPMWNVTGMSGAAPLFAKVMSTLHKDRSSKMPVAPSGIVKKLVTWNQKQGASQQLSFIQGTEPTGTQIQTVQTQAAQAKILYPTEGLIVALDPDIPMELQKMFVEFKGDSKQLRVFVNTNRLYPNSDGSILWPIEKGVKTLELQDKSGKVLDKVKFVVRAPRMNVKKIPARAR